MVLCRGTHSECLANNKNKNTKVIKKATTVSKPTFKAPAATATVAKRTVSRDKVLRNYTVAELEKLIGRDTPVGVSFKSLKLAIVSQHSDKVLATLG